MTIRTPTLLAVAGLLALAAAPAAADVEQDFALAAKAHRAGDYARAAALWRPLANAGQRDAQFNLGQMYYEGEGVPRDRAEAARWYRLAAEQGDIAAQYRLGLMYLNGDGVAASETEAHRWFVMNRAAHHHHAHSAQMVRWRDQAKELLWRRDMAESIARSRESGDQVLAELKRRLGPSAPTAIATGPESMVVR